MIPRIGLFYYFGSARGEISGTRPDLAHKKGAGRYIFRSNDFDVPCALHSFFLILLFLLFFWTFFPQSSDEEFIYPLISSFFAPLLYCIHHARTHTLYYPPSRYFGFFLRLVIFRCLFSPFISFFYHPHS